MFGLSSENYPLNLFEESNQYYWEALHPNLPSTAYQQQHILFDMPNDQNPKSVNENAHINDEHIEVYNEERALNPPIRRENFKKDKRKKCNKKQSAKHNFSAFLIRQTKRLLKVHLQSLNIQQLEDKYLQFVLKNLKQSRASLKYFIINLDDQPTHLKKFEPFFRQQHISQIGRVQQLRICRQYFRTLVLNNKEGMIEMAVKGQIQKEERRKSFVEFIERFLQELEKGRVKGKDQKEIKEN